jgi:membrane protease YdiL (CAAX protease family)
VTVIVNSDYGQIIQYLLFDAVNLFYGAVILIIAWFCFARRLKGFGFRGKGIFRDLNGAVVNYLAVIPLVLIGLHIVLLVGSLLRPGFEMEVHEGLEAVSGDASLWLRVVVIFSVVVVAPFFEELMFRGLLQTVIGSYLPKPWIAIAVASVMFVLMHMNSTHWLALFGLSCVLGYSYEKSGSLVRPMLIHAIFNGVSVAMTIIAGPPVT